MVFLNNQEIANVGRETELRVREQLRTE